MKEVPGRGARSQASCMLGNAVLPAPGPQCRAKEMALTGSIRKKHFAFCRSREDGGVTGRTPPSATEGALRDASTQDLTKFQGARRPGGSSESEESEHQREGQCFPLQGKQAHLQPWPISRVHFCPGWEETHTGHSLQQV